MTRTAERRYPNNFQAADLLGYVGQINDDELGGAPERRLPAERHHRQDRYRADVRVRAARHAGQGQGRGRQPGPRGERRRGEEARSRTRRAPHRRPAVQHIAEESLAQGMEGARTLVDPDSGNYYAANAGAVVVLDARTGRWWRWRRTRASTPTTSSPGTSDQYFKDPNHPLHQPSAEPVRARLDVQDVHVAGDAAERPLPGGRQPRRDRLPRRVLPLRQRREALQRGEGGARCGEPAVGAHGVERRVLLHGGQRVLEPLPRRGQGRGLHRRPRRATRSPTPSTRSATRSSTPRATYGFGESTGIGLGDQAGVVPDHEYRVKLNPNNPDNQFWRRGDSASLAVGQGDVLVTPLQLANAYAAFANGGTLYQPRLVDEVTQSSGGLPAGSARAGGAHHRPAGEAHDRPHPRGARRDRRRPRRRRRRTRTAPRSARSATTRASR